MGDVLARIATVMAPLAREQGFTRKGRIFRREDEAGTVAFLAIRSTPVTHRAFTAFRVFGSVSPIEWTAWIRRSGDPSSLQSPADGLQLRPLKPPFELWDREVTGRFWGNYPFGQPTPDEPRDEGTWTFVNSEGSVEAYGKAVVEQLVAQHYISDLVNLMNRGHLREVLAHRDGAPIFWHARGAHFMLEASADPDQLDALLASAVPPLPPPMEAFIRTTLPTLDSTH